MTALRSTRRFTTGTPKALAPSASVLPSAALLCAWLLSACAGTPAAFGPKYPDNEDGDIAELAHRVRTAPARAVSNIAVGVTSAPQKLYAFDLTSQRVLWQKAVNADSAPVLAGDTVVLQSGDDIVGYSLGNGERQFDFDRGTMVLKGADGEGAAVIVAIGEGMGTFARSEAVFVQRGSVAWRRDVEGMIGVPAIAGDTALVPWSNQFMSAIDTDSGREYARVRVRDGVISHAIRAGSDVVIGSRHGITRVGLSVGSGTLRGAGSFALPHKELPGRPLLLRDVYVESTAPTADSAAHRISLVWYPSAIDNVRLGLQDDTVYLVFYRFVFGLDPKDFGVRWVYLHDTDLVGASAQIHGLAVADDGGNFTVLGATSGEVVWKAQTSLLTTVAVIPGGGTAADPGTVLTPEALASSLLAAAQDTDARMVPARLLAVEKIASLPQAEATSNLIEICDNARIAPPVRERACVALKQRNVGAEHLLYALQRHAGFLEGTTSPPVGALAKASAALKETRAVGPLIAHLNDPGTRSSDLPPLVSALHELGDASAAEPLAAFLKLYHADPIDEHVVRALELVPAALVALSGPVAQPALEAVTFDELGAHSVRLKAKAELDLLLAQQAAAQKSDEARQAAQDEAVQKEEAPADPEKFAPTHLTSDLVSQALLPVRDQLVACLTGASKPLFQARVVIAVEEGVVKMVSTLPAEVQACVEPLVKAQKFPRTKMPKLERVTHTLKR
jgi:hypothetical protein